jgi:hypothetical protein
MHVLRACVILLTLITTSGCAIVEKEMTNRGGYLDAVLDDHWMKADSKAMRALRAFAIEVSLARIASVSAKNESDRQLLAIRIGALTKRFTPIYMCAFGKNPLAVPGAETDPCFYYDSAMVDYSTGLFDLAMVALPIEDGQKLVNVVSGSFVNPVDTVGLLNALLQIGKDAIKYGRVVGALYRDTVELEVQLWLTTPQVDNRPPPYRVTTDDVAALYSIYARGNDDMPAWLAEIAKLKAQGLEPIPQAKFYYELGALMSYICNLITSDATTKKACQANLPSSTINPAPVLGASLPFVIGTTPKPIPVGLQNPAPKPVSNAGSQTDFSNAGDVVQACHSVWSDPNAKADQQALCKSVGIDSIQASKVNAPNMGTASVALKSMVFPNSVALPSQTTLADVITGNQDPYVKARVAINAKLPRQPVN